MAAYDFNEAVREGRALNGDGYTKVVRAAMSDDVWRTYDEVWDAVRAGNPKVEYVSEDGVYDALERAVEAGELVKWKSGYRLAPVAWR